METCLTPIRKAISVGMALLVILAAVVNFIAASDQTVAEFELGGVPLIPAFDVILLMSVLLLLIWLAPRAMLFVAALLFVLAAGAMLVFTPDWNQALKGNIGLPAVLAVASGLIAAITFGLVLYLLYRVIKQTYILLSSGLAVNAARSLTVLLSLAVAATIFKSGALDAFDILYRFVELLFVYFPRAIVDVITSSYSCGFIPDPKNQAFADCIARVATIFAKQPQQFFTSLLQDFRSIVSLLQFFAAWSLLVWVLDGLFARTDTATSNVFWSTVSSLSATTRKRISFAAIIVVAAYLSLCAIVAVSVFKPAERSQLLNDDAFKMRLDEAKLTNSDDKSSPFSDRFPKNLEAFPEKEKKEPAVPRYESIYQLLNGEYSEFQNRWSTLRGNVLSEQEQLAHRALTSYRLENFNRTGLREQINHSMALESWYDDYLSGMYQQLERCRNDISAFLFQAKAALTAAQVPQESTARLGPTTGSTLDPFQPNIFALSERARQTCAFKGVSTEGQPHRSDFGYTLGIMGALSIWLLSTESMPLALITGLVGFGLFGALVSSLIRKPSADPTESDLLGVVARGVSAAIVVFLAAYGGIAIVAQAQAGGDPNPYVVFVTCLVGAVFSDIVWAKAKRRFAEENGTSETPGTSSAKVSPPQPSSTS
jgi:hypothetical protein